MSDLAAALERLPHERLCPVVGGYSHPCNCACSIVLDALDAAEQERDELRQRCEALEGQVAALMELWNAAYAWAEADKGEQARQSEDRLYDMVYEVPIDDTESAARAYEERITAPLREQIALLWSLIDSSENDELSEEQYRAIVEPLLTNKLAGVPAIAQAYTECVRETAEASLKRELEEYEESLARLWKIFNVGGPRDLPTDVAWKQAVERHRARSEK